MKKKNEKKKRKEKTITETEIMKLFFIVKLFVR